jgi:hypothetical protein
LESRLEFELAMGWDKHSRAVGRKLGEKGTWQTWEVQPTAGREGGRARWEKRAARDKGVARNGQMNARNGGTTSQQATAIERAENAAAPNLRASMGRQQAPDRKKGSLEKA